MKQFLAMVQSNPVLTAEQFTAYLAQGLQQDLAPITLLDELHQFKAILFEFNCCTELNAKRTVEDSFNKHMQALTDSSETGKPIFEQELAMLKTIAAELPKSKLKLSLLAAVRDGNLAALEKALAGKSIDLDEEDAAGNALLIIALQNDFIQGFKLLLQKGANINCCDKSTNKGLLEIALTKNNTEALAVICATKHGKELIANYLSMQTLRDGSFFVNIKNTESVKKRLAGLLLLDKGLENAGVAQDIPAPAYFNESCFLLDLFTYLYASQNHPEFELLSDQEKNEFINARTPLLAVLINAPIQIPEQDKQRVYLELYRMVKVLVSDVQAAVKLQAIQQFETAVKIKADLWKRCKQTLAVIICAAVGLALGVTLVGGLGILLGVWASPIAVTAALYGLTTTGSITAWTTALVGIPLITSITAGAVAKFCFFKPNLSEKIVDSAYAFVAAEQLPKLKN